MGGRSKGEKPCSSRPTSKEMVDYSQRKAVIATLKPGHASPETKENGKKELRAREGERNRGNRKVKYLQKGSPHHRGFINAKMGPGKVKKKSNMRIQTRPQLPVEQKI